MIPVLQLANLNRRFPAESNALDEGICLYIEKIRFLPEKVLCLQAFSMNFFQNLFNESRLLYLYFNKHEAERPKKV